MEKGPREAHVYRGGSCFSKAALCRAAFRSRRPQGKSFDYLGCESVCHWTELLCSFSPPPACIALLHYSICSPVVAWSPDRATTEENPQPTVVLRAIGPVFFFLRRHDGRVRFAGSSGGCTWSDLTASLAFLYPARSGPPHDNRPYRQQMAQPSRSLSRAESLPLRRQIVEGISPGGAAVNSQGTQAPGERLNAAPPGLIPRPRLV